MALRPCVALLRAANVGGRGKVAMADLRALAADLRLGGPRTLLQSGNLVFRAAASDEELEALLQRECERRLGLETDILVRGRVEWEATIAANPFQDEAARDPSHLLVMALKNAPAAGAIAALRAAIVGREQAWLGGRALYVTYPDGIGDSRLTSAAIERRLGARGTARNWNTVLKLAAMLADGE